MGYIPIRLPIETDEILYSYIFRTAAENGLSFEVFTKSYLFKQLKNGRQLNHKTISYDTSNVFMSFHTHMYTQRNMLDLFAETSVYAYESIAMTQEEQTRYICGLSQGEVLNSPVDSLVHEIHFCPECLHDDGVIYIHRAHQLDGVYTCHIHGCRLKRYVGIWKEILNVTDADLQDIEGIDDHPIDDDARDAYAKYAKSILDAGRLDICAADIKQLLTCKRHELTCLYAPDAEVDWKYKAILPFNIKYILTTKIYTQQHLPMREIVPILMYLYPDPMDFLAAVNHSSGVQLTQCTQCAYEYLATELYRKFDTTVCPACLGANPNNNQFGLWTRAIDSEYEPKSSFSSIFSPIRLLHHKCGKQLSIKPREFLFNNVRCKCSYSFADDSQAKRAVSNANPEIDLVKFNKSSNIAMFHHSVCDRDFQCVLDQYLKEPFCRACSPGREEDDLFRQKVRDLSGDEYTVLSDWIGNTANICIKHNVCGNVNRYSPLEFISGKRCPVCTAQQILSYLNHVLEICSNGRYEIIDSSQSRYMVRDHEKNITKNVSPYILQREIDNGSYSILFPGLHLYDKWSDGYDYLKRFLQKNENVYIHEYVIYDGFELGRWCQEQRKEFANGNMNPEHYNALIDVGFHFYSQRDQEWLRKFELCRKYLETTGNTSIAYDTVYEGVHLGKWMTSQYHKHKIGCMSTQKKELLADLIPDFAKHTSSKADDLEWMRKLQLYRQYNEATGETYISYGIKCEGEFIGAWVEQQYQQAASGSLQEERRVLLAEINPFFAISENHTRTDVIWIHKLALYRRYIETTGDKYISETVDFDGEHLGRWLAVQRRQYNDGKLPEARRQLLAELDSDFFCQQVENARDAKWMNNYELYRRYIKTTGDKHISETTVFEGKPLGRWVRGQHKLHNDSKLSEERRMLLADLDPYFTLSGHHTIWDEEWMRKYDLYKQYIDVTGDAHISYEATFEGENLGIWVCTQYSRYKAGKMSEERRELFAELNPDFAVPYAVKDLNAEWMRRYKQYKRYYDETGETHVPMKTIFEGENLGIWVCTQYKRYKTGEMLEERRALLAELNPDFAVPYAVKDLNAEWMRRYEQYKRYCDETGEAHVPIKTIFEGENLGRWVCTQYSRYKSGKTSEERRALLAELNPNFAIPKTVKDLDKEWIRRYEQYKRYYDETGNAHVPQKAIFEGERLGVWVCTQYSRYKAGKTSEERRALLAELNPDFAVPKTVKDLDKEWMRRYDQYKRYFDATGNAHVPSKTVFESERLGLWVRNQYSRYKTGKMSEERRALLAELNPDFAVPKFVKNREAEWMRRYDQYKRYFDATGNAHVPSKTVFESENLGVWVGTQYSRYKAGKLLETHRLLLAELNADFAVSNPETIVE